MITEESLMYKELNLLIPSSLLFILEKQAGEQGIPLETLCLRLLSGQRQEENLTDPYYYGSLTYDEVKHEIRCVMESDLPKDEARKRINTLEFQISKRYIR
jgi:hypothetical protein